MNSTGSEGSVISSSCRDHACCDPSWPVGLGVSSRLNDAIVGLFELQINDNFHVGYAYDFTTSQLNRFSNESHELMINYRIKIARFHKGLECPTYW